VVLLAFHVVDDDLGEQDMEWLGGLVLRQWLENVGRYISRYVIKKLSLCMIVLEVSFSL
jgi:hypothetical protein